MEPEISSNGPYFKITNIKENHNGFQYYDGLNVLIDKFNNNPSQSCVKGGLYFTTKEFIHEFYDYGDYLRVIELPTTDLDFKMVKDPQGDKYRANKIILKERYSLADIETYHKFGIKYPTLTECVESGYLEMVKYLSAKPETYHKFGIKYPTLTKCAESGYLEMVKYLFMKGADIHANNDEALILSAGNGHLEMVKYLFMKGADIHANNDNALRSSAGNGHTEVVKYLVERGADI